MAKPEPVRPPFVLSVGDIAVLSLLLGVNLTSPAQLVQRAHGLLTISVEGVEVTFKPGVLQRLLSRAGKAEFRLWLADKIREWAYAYVRM